MLRLLLAVLLVAPSASSKQLIRVDREQASFLKKQAKRVRNNLKDTRKKLEVLERGPRRPWWCMFFPFPESCLSPANTPTTPPIARFAYSPAGKNVLGRAVAVAIRDFEDTRTGLEKILMTQEQLPAPCHG